MAAVLSTASLASCVVEERTLTLPLEDAGAEGSAPPWSPRDAESGDSGEGGARPPAPRVECVGATACARALRAPALRWEVDGNSPLGQLPPLSETFCALLASGKVACWGDNRRGQLGRPVIVETGAPDFVPGIDGAAELDRGCALLGDKRASCWGSFVSPEIGVDEAGAFPAARTLAIPPAKKIRMTSEIGCALLAGDAGDRVSCWGLSRGSGQLAFAAAEASEAGVFGPAIAPVPDGLTVLDVVVSAPSIDNPQGYYGVPFGGASFLMMSSGQALSWGGNLSLGRVSSFVPDPNPTAIDVDAVSAISAAGASVCAIATGEVYCWGNQGASPKRIGVYDAVDVATAGPASFGRGCAVVRSGDVYCWGTNDFGQAGDGTETLAPSPVKVADLPHPAVAVEVTQRSSCAVLVNGDVYCWGDATRGQLGRSVAVGLSLVPVKVALPEEP